MNISLLLDMAADTFGDRTAIVCGSLRLSYAQLREAARASAELLVASGAQHLALLDTASPAVPVAVFGCAIAGVPYVPINYRLTAPEIEALLERVTPALLVGGEQYLAGRQWPAQSIIPTGEFLARTTTAGASAPREAAYDEGDAIAVLLFTSGTSGPPKAALLRHRHLCSYILNSVEFASAGEDEASLVCVPPYHVAGTSAMLSATYAGRRIVQLPNFSPAEWLELCSRERVTHAFVVPTMLMRIIGHLQEHPHQRGQLATLRAISYGGGKMPLPVISQALAVLPDVDFTNAYGLTETSSTITVLGPEDHRAAATSTDPLVQRRLSSAGRALPGVELQVRGDDGRPLPPGAMGDIFVRGPQVAGEYAGRGSVLDAEGWFPTRDHGCLDADGFLFLEGRSDDIIVRGGENISPAEIEDVLLGHAAVADAAVFAIPDEQWGEGVAAAVILNAGATAAAPELQELVRGRLRSSRVPQAVFFVDALPYNETGKLQRRLLRQQFGQGA